VTGRPVPISAELRIEGQGERRMSAPLVDEKLVASLAHEISNPLETLRNILYLLQKEATFTQKGRQYMALAREEIDRTSQIAHAAMHRARDTAVPTPTNVPDLLRSVLDFYKPRFESPPISVHSRFCQDDNRSVYAGLLRQVFSNLLLNSIDAMPKGGRLHARISHGCERSGRHRRGLRVTIADNGSGIPADKLSRVLDPFFTTKGDKGNGLGLSLVREVVQKHRGVLRVRSSVKPGRSGSVFTIFLPRGN